MHCRLFQSLRKEVNTRAESDLGDSRITSNTRPAALSSIRPNGRSTSTPIEAKPKEISDPSFEVHEYLRSSFGGDIEIQSRGSLVSLTTLSEICEDRQVMSVGDGDGVANTTYYGSPWQRTMQVYCAAVLPYGKKIQHINILLPLLLLAAGNFPGSK